MMISQFTNRYYMMMAYFCPQRESTFRKFVAISVSRNNDSRNVLQFRRLALTRLLPEHVFQNNP